MKGGAGRDEYADGPGPSTWQHLPKHTHTHTHTDVGLLGQIKKSRNYMEKSKQMRIPKDARRGGHRSNKQNEKPTGTRGFFMDTIAQGYHSQYVCRHYSQNSTIGNNGMPNASNSRQTSTY